jgi:pyruvate/2-oxoglutarate/acetoin dehydrogenase E1 component/TPP-dependent pyruvate/acetoin dehydrogenase alpha subunit
MADMGSVVEKLETKFATLEREEVLRDYRIAQRSRQVSLIGRREALSGRAKFGIFGGGKEVAQIALAKVFRRGDFRAGYYRDQTLMFALGMVSIEEFFAQLYAHADVNFDPNSAGRQMNAHFATRLLRVDGSWKNQSEMLNTSADLSPTGAQMPRLVGLAYASRLYRELEELKQFKSFSHNGNEIAFGTIGNASTAEGMFWESINAAGVLKVPMVLSIWDDRYGISVSNEHQMVKGSISEILEGFRRENGKRNGYDIYKVRAWDYPALIRIYRQAAQTARQEHVPAIIHVVEATQPQGHSTSGSQERYKPAEQLAWDREHDCIVKMREWMLEQGLASAAELDRVEEENRKDVEGILIRAREAYLGPIREERDAVVAILEANCAASPQAEELQRIGMLLKRSPVPFRRSTLMAIRDALILLKDEDGPCRQQLIAWKKKLEEEGRERYSSHLYSQSSRSTLRVEGVKPVYGKHSPMVSGFEILNAAFDDMLAREPRLIAFGQDVGRLGDVNQGMAGLQEKYGQLRVADAGIRETTIIGQAIGMALRGLRPIAEIQYLDYVLYALQIMSDDLATLHWRTKGGQKAPVIIRTRGHRLEGVWHAGSPMAGIIHLLRGIRVLVPRDMTRAAGFYNTLLGSDEPGLVVEVLNGYRLKEKMPQNIGELALPVGVPEILRPGGDVTLVTYGALCRIAMETAGLLSNVGIEVEVIDVQSLLPFDIHGMILESLKKTGRIIFVDEDVPGGTTAYMMQEVVEKQGGFWHLDSEPKTLSAQAHRPAYGSDGDYWSKPNTEQIFEAIYDMMNEAEPDRYPVFYR